AQYLPGDLRPRDKGEGELVDDPSAGGVIVRYVPQLHKMIGKEIVLLRAARNGADVGLAPIDSFDCTGLAHQTYAEGAPTKTAEAWHYVRANDRDTRAWHFVYPGRYQANN